MMHSPSLLEIFQEAEKRSAGQPYPVYVNNLAAAGVRSYTVAVDTQDRRVFFSTHQQMLNIPGTTTPVTCAEKFDLEKIKAALHRTQTGQSDYPTFMQEIAAAGVHFYIADVENRKVSYHGKSPYPPYEEAVPVMENNN